MQTFNSRFQSDASAVCQPTHDEIACAAYFLYLDQGSQHGHDLNDWLRAEQWLLLQSYEAAAPRFEEPPWPENTIAPGIHPLERRDHPGARDERGSPDRTEIRRNGTSYRPASRQTHSGPQYRRQSARVNA